MHLKEIMTSLVATIASDDSIAHAARKMLKLDIGLLPVSNGQRWRRASRPSALFRWATSRSISDVRMPAAC